MLRQCWLRAQLVRHRIDGLEKPRAIISPLNAVRHRIDGLEKDSKGIWTIGYVRHRIDGLEKQAI